MTRRHPVDIAILTGLAVGHFAIIAQAVRMVHALIQWGRRNEA